jgi:hypothetical protein
MEKYARGRGRSRGLLGLLLGASLLAVGAGKAAPAAAATLSGQVFNDVDNNGVLDGGDAPLPGIPVQLRTGATRGLVLAQATTGATGGYSFINVPPGTYRLVALLPQGVQSLAAYPGLGGTVLDSSTIRVTVVDGETISSNNFLDRGSVVSPTVGAISGSVVRDVDNNGGINVPPDVPIPGVPIQLFTQLNVPIAQAFTDVNGAYAFTNVPPGFYQVVQQVPAGLAAVSPSALSVMVAAGINNGNNNFLDRATVVSPTVGIISGSVVQDVDNNGVIDVPPDAPLQGIPVQLFTQVGGFIAQAFTDVNGAYAFTNVPPGFYQVVQQVPSGLTSVAAFPGPNAFPVNGSSTALQVTVVSGVTSGNNNFLDRAAQTLGTISGSVIQDFNGNGLVNVPPDAPLPGVQVLLETLGGQTLRSFTTDVNGAWAFSNLAPGTYQVVQIVPANFAAIAAFPGPGGAVVSPTTLQVTISGGLSGNNNFLDRGSVVSPTVGTISGSVVQDVDNNGFIDVPPDAPISGVQIQLFTQLNVPVAQAFTDVNGAYAFTNVPPGFYQVVQQVPAGFAAVSPTILSVTSNAGAINGNNNFLDRAAGSPAGANSISGFAIRDLNVNGIADNEPGLAGMRVVISDTFGNPLASVVTDVTGIFRFTNVPAGTFTLTATPPAGLFSTNALPGMGGTRRSANSISVTTTPGSTDFAGQLFLAGP